MEDSGTSQVCNSFSTLGISESGLPPQLKFIMSNIKNIIGTQLTTDNYPMWRSQVLKLMRANGLESFLDGSKLCPPKTFTSDTGDIVINPMYNAFLLIDQNLASALYSTISSTILPYVITLDTTHEIWSTIEKRLQATNRSRVIQLKQELHNVVMKNQSMVQYLTQIKSIVDNIEAAVQE